MNIINSNINFQRQSVLVNNNINKNINNSNLPISNLLNNNNETNSSKKDENEYVLYFNFSNGKQLYLNVNKFLIFSQVIIELKSNIHG